MRRLQTVFRTQRRRSEPKPNGQGAVILRDLEVTLASRALYEKRNEQNAARMGVEPSSESWEDYCYALPVFARDIREQAVAVLLATRHLRSGR